MAYATVAELKARINKTGSGDDTVLEALLEAATLAIDRYCNRLDGFVADSTASARTYVGSGGVVQRIDECVEVTKVEVKDSVTDTDYVEWSSSDYILASGDPRRPEFNRLPYTLLIIDPNGDYDYFTGGEYTGRGGFKPLVAQVRGVPTVRVTAKWGFATSVPYDIKELCIMQAARWYKELEGSMAGRLTSVEIGEMDTSSLMGKVKAVLDAGRYKRVAIG